MKHTLRLLYSFAAVFSGALLAKHLNLPIPWLLGPLLVSSALSICGIRVRTLPGGRQAGLAVIGMSLGLYFTPKMLGLIAEHWLWLLAGMAFALLLTVLGTLLVRRLTDEDFTTAWFASAVGGASEMAVMAAQNGARVDKVVAAHSLRVLLVVTIVPFFYQYQGYHGLDGSLLAADTRIHPAGLLLLAAACGSGGWLFLRLGWSNPWTFGPLLASVLLTAAEIHLSAVPPELSALGQLLIGWTLGTKFAPDFFRAAPRLLAATAANVCLGLLLTWALALLLAPISGIALPTLGLSLAPGGVAEMTITAKVLQLGVPLVTAFHVARMITIVGAASWLYRLFAKRFG
ncbi:AbrB family transcriptional regulator [Bergeriella denitrificans]|uniref:Ammonia monooxygenase n=1 Tax=Bergeriella denitrificans TaxID=494 RepID=A0A378UJH9_BERDE|nr:AbrB family transcriptional regulator [Bergeriella denitrificans]STZ77445.1 Putative ammonia monooxygenase [Bergeriella denitrificans]